MVNLKHIIREQLEDKICKLVQKTLDKKYTLDGSIFIKTSSDEYGSYDLPYPVKNKDEYWDLYYSMEDLIESMLGMDGEDIGECIEDYIDSKITYDIWDNEEEFLDEAEEAESGGEKSSSGGESKSSGKEWESGLTRGPSNPITYDSQWTGQRGWEGIKSLTTKRGKANPIE